MSENLYLHRYETIKQALPAGAKLLVVTKGQPASRIVPLLEAGHRYFGENRISEAADKWPLLRQAYPDVHLHFIGQLQTKKAKEALAFFDVIQSLDRDRLAEKLVEHRSLWRPGFHTYIQLNMGQEPQKGGLLPHEFPVFLDRCRKIYHLPVAGVMAIPPQNKDPIPYFQALKTLATLYQLPECSMGMSQDYQLALACGSTMLRIGSGIFEDAH